MKTKKTSCAFCKFRHSGARDRHFCHKGRCKKVPVSGSFCNNDCGRWWCCPLASGKIEENHWCNVGVSFEREMHDTTYLDCVCPNFEMITKERVLHEEENFGWNPIDVKRFFKIQTNKGE